jgi:glycosyltransferase involved in cell wall biosynthesis
VIAEALCCGKPIILSNKTPWNDLESNKCGILVNNDSNSFSSAFNEIKSMKFNSEKIKSIAKVNFDWTVISQKFLKNFIID